jgi:hypothetical protein
LKTYVYTPFLDLGFGDFVSVRHADLELYPVWMGRAENEVVKDENFEKI